MMRKATVLFLALLALVFALAVTAGAYSVQTIQGTVNASAIEAGDLVLTGNTTIVMDKDLSLRSICGDYDLTLQDDGGHKLTVTTPLSEQTITANGSGHAISVKSFQSNASLDILSRKDGLNIDGDIYFIGSSLSVNSKGGDAVYSRNGNITILNATTMLTADGSCIYSKTGTVKYDGPYLLAETTSKNYYCIVGQYVNLKGGTITASSTAHCIVSFGASGISLSGKITATGGRDYGSTINARNNGSICIDGGSDVSVKGEGYGLYAGNAVIMDGDGKLDVRVGAKAAVYAKNGNVVLKGDIYLRSYQHAIAAENGNITVTGSKLDAQNSGDACCDIQAKNVNINVTEGKLFSPSKITVRTAGDMTLSGDILAMCDSASKDSAVLKTFDGGNITLGGGNITLTGKGYAVYASGDFTSSAASLTASAGGRNAIFSDKHILFDNADSVNSVSGGGGLYSTYSTTINCSAFYLQSDGIGICTHKGSKEDDYIVVNCGDLTIESREGGMWAEIGTINLNGKITVTNTHGCSIYVVSTITGKVRVDGDLTVNHGSKGSSEHYPAVMGLQVQFFGKRVEIRSESGKAVEATAKMWIHSDDAYFYSANEIPLRADGQGDVITGIDINTTHFYAETGKISEMATVFSTPKYISFPAGSSASLIKPEGGHWNINGVFTKDGRHATVVEISKRLLPFTISLPETARVGDDLIPVLDMSGEMPEGNMQYYWESSEDGTSWKFIVGGLKHYEVNAGNAGKLIRLQMSLPSGNYWPVNSNLCRVLEQDAITGGIVYTSAIRYTSPLSPAQTARTGKLAEIEASEPSRVHFQWQRSEDGQTGWTDIKKSESATALTSAYTVGSDSCGKYIRLTATVDGMTGVVVGSPKYVAKLPGKLSPENYPQLATAEPYNSVTVTNAKAAQEYTITESAAAPDFEHGRWSVLSDGTLSLPAEPGKLWYVHTRVKETAQREASDSVYSAIYTGTASVTQHPQKLTFDKSRIITKVGAVTQLTVRPLPADFAGWNDYTLRWYVNSPIGGSLELYADKECTQPLTTSMTTQHTIWVKGAKQERYASVDCEKQISYNEVLHDSCGVQVADADGNFVLESLSFKNITLFPGESAQLTYTAKPVPAAVNGVISMVKGWGNNPDSELEFAVDGTTITVTAPENADLGTYYYEARIDGKTLFAVSGIQITVSDKTATVSFDPGNPGAKVYAKPGAKSVSMAPQTVPLGAEYVLPENGFDAPDGYEFAGWNLGEIGDGVNITEDTKITARWKAHEHSMTYTPAYSNDCTHVGCMGFYYCEGCGKCFGDEAGLYSSWDDPAMFMIPAAGHTAGEPVRENEIAESCTAEGGFDTVTYCTVCGEELSRNHTTLLTNGHVAGEPVRENEIAPTCDTDGGYDTFTYCTVCSEAISWDHTVLPATGHTPENVPAKAATCTADGNTEYLRCETCGALLAAQTQEPIEDPHDIVIDALGHDLVHHEAQAPTETEVGWEAYDTCTRCDYTTYVELPALGGGSVPGDINGDGAVNAKDVTFLRRALAGGYGVAVNNATADVNKDGSVNAKDVTYLRRALAGGYGITLG